MDVSYLTKWCVLFDQSICPVWPMGVSVIRFEDLKAALQHMKRNAHQISEGPISVVRSNLSAIFDCLDSLTSKFTTS